MKIKFLTLLVFLSSALTSGCVWTLCESQGWTPNFVYVVTYHYPPTARRDILVQADSQGVLRYPPDRDGQCGRITVQGGPPRRFFSTPDSINLQAPPASVNISGSDISAAYGMPMVEFYDNNFNFVARVTASAVAPDGTWLEATTPNLSSVYNGNYQLHISQYNADGTISLLGITYVDCYGRAPVDADGDGWYSYQDCDDNSPYINPGASPDCFGMSYDQNCNGRPDSEECAGCTDPRMECHQL